MHMKNNVVSPPFDRVVALDKIRYSMVAGVVILHAACAYANIIPWWSVRENELSRFFDVLIFGLDIFLMPVLYFIAGFFAFSSLAKYGAGGFITAKLRRLGGPLILLGLFFVPSISFIGYQSRTANPAGFLQFWWMQMQTVLERHWILYTSMEVAAQHPNDYSPWHLWFISLLLVFFILAAGCYRFFPGWFVRSSRNQGDVSPRMRSGLFTAVACGTFFTALVQQVSPDWAWGKIGFFLIQPARVPIYAVLFILGLYVHSRNWFASRRFPGHPLLWMMAALLLVFALSAILQSMGTQAAPVPWPQAILLGVLRMLASLSFLCLFLAVGQRWGQHPTAIWRFMHPVSYDIYLIHLPLVVIFQLVALHLAVPTGLKFAVISLTSLITCGLFSRYIVKPYPRLGIVLLFGIFGLSALII